MIVAYSTLPHTIEPGCSFFPGYKKRISDSVGESWWQHWRGASGQPMTWMYLYPPLLWRYAPASSLVPVLSALAQSPQNSMSGSELLVSASVKTATAPQIFFYCNTYRYSSFSRVLITLPLPRFLRQHLLSSVQHFRTDRERPSSWSVKLRFSRELLSH